MTRPWWRERVGYEVYLRSFADGDGDGVGDLHGLRERLDHLAWLGVGIVWVTPFYPSPMHDHGYDVADYTGVEPAFGDLAAFDAMVARAHELGLRVVIDLVPNHTSSEHPWFRSARSSRASPYRDYYIWRDGSPDGGPPNNWLSHFGGPAWTFDEATGQWWCHLFLPEQPDLNWANPAVGDEFDEILRFWLRRGVDGFRIDVAHALVKHPEFLDLPPRPEPPEQDPARGPLPVMGSLFDTLDHIYDAHQPGVLDVYRRWRRVVKEHDALLLGEVYVLDAERLAPYVADQDGLHLSFWFRPLHVQWDPRTLRGVLADGLEAAPGHIAWVQGSHDRGRAASRWGGGDVGRRRQLALATLQLGLPGVPFVYQGEELGLEDVPIPPAAARDPIALRDGGFDRTRDVSRTPMPWEPGPGYGFTTAERPWLPFGDHPDGETVAGQRVDPDSFLHRYRALIATRRQLDSLHGDEHPVWLDDGDVLAYRRGGAVVAANCGERPAVLRLPGPCTVAFATRRAREGSELHDCVELDPEEALIARLEA